MEAPTTAHAPNRSPSHSLLCVLLVGLAACGAGDTHALNGTMRVGVLLPYTGDAAESAVNVERAILLAFEAADAAGSIGGERFGLLFGNTRSDWRYGIQKARQHLEEPGLLGIIGPQSEELAVRLSESIAASKVAEITGSITSPSYTRLSRDGFWFRTNPSADQYCRALVARLAADGIKSATVLFANDELGSGFAAVLPPLLYSSGITVLGNQSFRADGKPDTEVLLAVREQRAKAVILVANPKAGAAIVQEWVLLGNLPTLWVLAPTLASPAFLSNAPPGALDGALGVAARLTSAADTFDEAFRDRWSGDIPLLPAYFYYDAAAVLILATAAAASKDGGPPTAAAVRDCIVDVSAPPGEQIAWDALARGVKLAAEGQPVDYQGVSGTVDLQQSGNLNAVELQFWTVQDDAIKMMENAR